MNDLARELFSALRPLQFSDEIRVGSQNDGGYVVPKFVVTQTTDLISIGYGHDSNFEREFLRLSPSANCRLFESSISLTSIIKSLLRSLSNKLLLRRAFPLYHLKCIFLFIQTRFTPKIKYVEREVRLEKLIDEQISFSSILEEVGPESRLFIKMDIEGGEYEVLPGSSLGNAAGMIIEFHDIIGRYEQFLSIISNLKKNYFISHIHLNNFAQSEGGIPDVIEVTLVHKDLVQSKDNLQFKNSIPTELDSPCNASKKDLIIYF